MIWTDDEENILKKLWVRQDMNRFSIAEILTNRTPSAIARKASEMNLKKEAKIEIDYEKLREVELFEI